MDKSNIINQNKIDQAVKQAVNHVRKWTRKELQSLLDNSKHNKKPLIVPITKNCFLIGNYAIRQVHDEWHMIYRYDDNELVFVNKQAAMLYAICQQTSQYIMAKHLQKNDEDIQRLLVKVNFYKQRMDISIKRKKNNDLYLSRYVEYMAKLKHNQSLLEKSLKLAKYFNH